MTEKCPTCEFPVLTINAPAEHCEECGLTVCWRCLYYFREKNKWLCKSCGRWGNKKYWKKRK